MNSIFKGICRFLTSTVIFMLRNYFRNLQRFKSNRKLYSSEENESDDEYLFLDIFTTLSTVTKTKTSSAKILDQV